MRTAPQTPREASHQNRSVTIVQEFNGGFVLKGRCGSQQGAEIDEIHRHFIRAEFLADWAEAKERHGKGVTITKDMLSRTDAQRSMDAFHKAMLAGATNPNAGGKVNWTTNLVIDQWSYERELAKIAGVPADQLPPVDPWDPQHPIRNTERQVRTPEGHRCCIARRAYPPGRRRCKQRCDRHEPACTPLP